MLSYPLSLIDNQYDQVILLLELIKEFIKQHENSTLPRVQSLVMVARRLRIFGCQQLRFFSSPTIEQVKEFPLEYIFALIHDQVARDFSVLREAVCQRTNANGEFLNTLEKADRFGQDILAPIIKMPAAPKFVQSWPRFTVTTLKDRQRQMGQLDKRYEPPVQSNEPGKPLLPTLYAVENQKVPVYSDKTVVITYFRKFPAIRLVPYASVALVGIPFTSVFRKQDLLATPHEIGHQVFWRWKELRAAVQAVRGELPEYAYNWTEEIFADVFGVQAAGAAAALCAQDLEASFDLEHFLKDDGAHPTSVLRPYVHIKALDDAVNPIVQQLNNAWTVYRLDRTNNGQHFKGKSDNQDVHIDGAVGKQGDHDYAPIIGRLPVDQMVALFLQKLPARTGVSGGQIFWKQSLGKTMDDQYPDFINYLSALTDPILEFPQDRKIIDYSTKDCTAIPLDETWTEAVKDYVPQNDPTTLLQLGVIGHQEWLPLMDMDAWAEKGPTSNPRSG